MGKKNLGIGKIKLLDIFHQKISFTVFFSYMFFLVAWFLDYYMTNTVSQGDFTMEGNLIARLWWQIMGPFRFIEFPIWAVAVFSVAYLINYKSKSLALFWLNFVAFQHVFGFITWLPFQYLYIIYKLFPWISNHNISLTSLLFSLLLVLFQTKFKFFRK